VGVTLPPEAVLPGPAMAIAEAMTTPETSTPALAITSLPR
jgi:hypothetical protein